MSFCLLFVNSAWQNPRPLVYFFYDGFDAFNFFTPCQTKHLLHFFTLDSSVGVAVFYIDTTDFIGSQFAFLAEESHNVALRQLVLLSFTVVYGTTSPSTKSGICSWLLRMKNVRPVASQRAVRPTR